MKTKTEKVEKVKLNLNNWKDADIDQKFL